MPHFALAAVGVDRPGIVAAVTGVLLELGVNLEDTSMTILRGQFAMMLVVESPESLTLEDLGRALEPVGSALDLAITVRPLSEVPGPDAPSPDAARYTASVYGADRPGIVHGVASLLASEGVNIVDLSTRVIGEPDRPVYAMFLELAVPATADPGELGRRLQAVAADLGVDATIHPSDADIL
ncbi:MAG TPA: ACT domain-containing protein [Acidimicrobiales bacterium]|nr:ACT domain-containing protein [Acidimicrobiales bacterium]